MIKHLFTTLCALALITAGSIPALAAEADTSESARYYPISVEEYTYEEQNEPRINKVYQLSLSDNPSGIPTKDFVRNGRLYYWEPSGETAVLCGTFPPCGHIVKRVPRHSCAADKPFTHSESTLANTDIIYDFSHSGNSINSLFSAIRQTGFGKISPSRIFII